MADFLKFDDLVADEFDRTARLIEFPIWQASSAAVSPERVSFSFFLSSFLFAVLLSVAQPLFQLGNFTLEIALNGLDHTVFRFDRFVARG